MEIIYIFILFIFFSSCQMYKLTNKIFNKIINICNKKGCPNIYGLIIHSIFFFILVYFFINLKEGVTTIDGVTSSDILKSSDSSVDNYNKINNKNSSHTHDISFSNTYEYNEIKKLINDHLIDSEDFNYIINHENFKYLIGDQKNLNALDGLFDTSYSNKNYTKLWGLLNSKNFNIKLTYL